VRPCDVRLILALAAGLCGAAHGDDEPIPRWRAPVEIRQAAPFVQLALPASAYAKSESSDLADLRVVDARDARVPYAFLAARAEARPDEQRKPATLYPLPARPAADGSWPLPVDITLDGNRVHVRRQSAAMPPASPARSAGWIVDLGERGTDEPVPRWLRLNWSGPAEFTAGYRLEASDDLRTWRSAGGGQVMALDAAGGPLTQPDVALPPQRARFLRLVWTEVAGAPAIVGADAVVDARRQVALDAPTELVVQGTPATPDAREAKPPPGALVFDLGGTLPIVTFELRFPSGTHVAPVRLQGRERGDQAWRDLGGAVFYRIERDGVTSTAPPLELHATARWVRVVPDARAGALDPAATSLAVAAQLARIVFPMQGTPPFAVLAGAPRAPVAALPATTLVPALDTERAHFGQAVLGAWLEDEAAARRLDAEQRDAQWRPRLLWGVLIAGVGLLAFMVWRLARAPAAGAGDADPAPPA